MPVLRKNHTRDFTVLPNSLLQDQRLSCRERGLLVWMLSKPQDWNFSHKALLAELQYDKKGAIQACINKLTETGYLRIVQQRTKGKLGKTLWYVFDSPNPKYQDTVIEASQPKNHRCDAPNPKYRDTANPKSPYPEIPDSGKPTSYKIKNKQKKEAAPALKGGVQLPEEIYFDYESGEFRRKGSA